MTICAKFNGRQVRDCTRGVKNCPCLFEQMQEALAMIAFPRRGSYEEQWDLIDVTNYIQANFDRKQLGIE